MAYKPGHIDGKKRMMLYLDEEVAKRLKVTAAETDTSMSDIANKAIKEAIGMTETVDIRSYLAAAESVQDLANRFTEVDQDLRSIDRGRFGDMHVSEWNWADDLPDEIAGRFTLVDPAELSSDPDIIARYRDEQTGEVWEVWYRQGHGDYEAVLA